LLLSLLIDRQGPHPSGARFKYKGAKNFEKLAFCDDRIPVPPWILFLVLEGRGAANFYINSAQHRPSYYVASSSRSTNPLVRCVSEMVHCRVSNPPMLEDRIKKEKTICRDGYSTVDGQTVRDALWIPIQTCRLQTTKPLVHYMQDVDN